MENGIKVTPNAGSGKQTGKVAENANGEKKPASNKRKIVKDGV